MPDYLHTIFHNDGMLAVGLPGYELRQGQLDMAIAVDAAICEGGHLLVEAACGIGKSIAYCVPVIANAACNKLRAVICTANIALQEQIMYKDLPFLKKFLPWDFTYSLLKGRNNFFCHEANMAAQVEGFNSKLSPEAIAQIERIRAWAKASKTGDKTDLGFEPDHSIWNKLSCTADDCKGANCVYRDSCFFERAKNIAWNSQIIVTNYHMLFGHIAARRSLGANVVLPSYDILILDEGHECGEIARNFMGFSLSKAGLQQVIKWTSKQHNDLSVEIDKSATVFFKKAKQVLKSEKYKIRLRERNWAEGKEKKLYDALMTVSTKAFVAAKSKDLAAEDKKYAADAFETCLTYAKRLEKVVQLKDDNAVYWLELGAKDQVIIKSRPISVDGYIEREVFDSTRTVVVSSATLTTGNTFEYIKKELGVPAEAKTMQIGSPFDWENRTLLVVPKDIPSVKEASFQNAIAGKVKQVIECTEGRALCLFTSIKSMQSVYKTVTTGNLPYTLLMQGEQHSRKELYEKFKADESSCLFGVSSFWTGIDVPGEALIALVIDKLPFPNISDPVIDAINEKDKDSFWNYMVPRAIITLKQGIGRLMRKASDYGVVTIMDNRLLTGSRWSKAFLLSLPPMKSTTNINEISTFLHYMK